MPSRSPTGSPASSARSSPCSHPKTGCGRVGGSVAFLLVDIREIDPRDDALLHRFWEIGKAADEVDRPWSTYWPWPSAQAALTGPNESRKAVLLAAFDGEAMLGIAEISLPLMDNTFAGYVELFVAPDLVRDGIGSALLDATRQVLAAHDRRLMMAEVSTPVDGSRSPGMWFAERHGLKAALTNEHRVLDLPATEDRWPVLTAEAAPHHADYRFVTWRDVVPADLLDGYCALQHAFNEEAPAGDLEVEAEHWDEARVRGKEERFRRAGRHETCTVAVAPDGTVAGLTEVMVSAHSPEHGMQGGTLVLRGHRGHRLGLALKLANQRAVRDRFPECAALHTWNADVNAAMNAINNRLGFETVELLVEMQGEVMT